MIAQAQPENQRHPGQHAARAWIRGCKRRRRAGLQPHENQNEEEEGVEGVDLGDDRLRPEHRRNAERESREIGRQAPTDERARAEPGGAAGQRAEQGAREMHAVGDRAERQVRKEMADQREQRIARRVLDAEEVARQDEKPVVLERHGARRSGGIEREERQGDGPGLQPVCPLGPERLSGQHQRLAQARQRVQEALTLQS